jgi:hypothetical protein
MTRVVIEPCEPPCIPTLVPFSLLAALKACPGWLAQDRPVWQRVGSIYLFCLSHSELTLLCWQRVQVMQAKKALLSSLHEDVANKEDGGLKRMLGEDPKVAQKREDCMKRLQMLQKVLLRLHSLSTKTALTGQSPIIVRDLHCPAVDVLQKQ